MENVRSGSNRALRAGSDRRRTYESSLAIRSSGFGQLENARQARKFPSDPRFVQTRRLESDYQRLRTARAQPYHRSCYRMPVCVFSRERPDVGVIRRGSTLFHQNASVNFVIFLAAAWPQSRRYSSATDSAKIERLINVSIKNKGSVNVNSEFKFPDRFSNIILLQLI